MPRLFVIVKVIALLMFWSAAAKGRPNIVVVVVDDLRYDEFSAAGHPYLETPNIDAVAENGTRFSNAYHVTPLCSPNRASLLTGQYPSRHGILDNTSRSRASHRLNLFAVELQKSGYKTAHVGKWHMGNDPTPRPGYDYWVSFAGQGKTVDPNIYEDGELKPAQGYITDLLTDRAVSFIENSGKQAFFLYLAHKAVHPDLTQLDDGSVDLSKGSRFVPAQRHQGRYQGRIYKRAPNYGFSKDEGRSKPVLKQALALKRSPEVQTRFGALLDEGVADETIRLRAEMVLAIDESLARIKEALRKVGVADNTVIIFTSDNGYYFGEHGLSVERRLPYEESLKAPLLIQHLGRPFATKQTDSLVLSIDLAPTVLAIAGTAIPTSVQGKSLLPILEGRQQRIREVAYMEYYSHENPMPWTVHLDYRVVRTESLKYIYWLRFPDQPELYDLRSDPHELVNLVDHPDFASTRRAMHSDIARLAIDALGLRLH